MKDTITQNLVTGQTMAQIIGVSIVTLRKWRNSGIIPYYQVGMKKKYSPQEVKKAVVKKLDSN